MSKSWKATLKLPKSSFPARPNPKLQQRYLRNSSDDLYQWQTNCRPQNDPFVLHDGPPYANGPLHIGHAINKILKDMIVRTQVQSGKRVVYVPGWDCHGLPIEMKALGSKTAREQSPVKVRELATRLASRTIAEQMKGFQSFGIMADWENKWTTMDREYETRQLRVFQKMVRHGLIYRKHKPVYWSVSSRTALAEAELEYRDDHVSQAAYVRFPIVSGWTSIPALAGFDGPLYAATWTTTPWTLPANRAIAVHNDLLYSLLRVGDYGLLVGSSRVGAMRDVLPAFEIVADSISGSEMAGLGYRNALRGKGAAEQPIVHADFVSADSGTGLVHLAPGHGQNEYEVCAGLGIDAFAPVTDEGFFTRHAYPNQPELLTGAPSVLEGGGKAVLELIGEDVLATHDVRHKYPYDWRTKQPVVVRATAQWFADVGRIKEGALQALTNVRFVPESGRSRLESFIKGRSEWCISRQRSWGVPIPALYDEAGNAVMDDESIEHIISVMQQRTSQAWFSDPVDDPAWVPANLQGRYRRGTDTMDVWFDSGTSWMEMGGPADVYLEGSDQHRGWFQSSLLTYVASQKADGVPDAEIQPPFKTLITHGFTLDAQGKKMSKSLGNTIVPGEVMDGRLLPPLKTKGKDGGKDGPRFDALGPDALRLWAASCDFTSDILVGASILQTIHSALVKYRTILKMVLGSLHESSRCAPLTKLDQMAIVQLSDTMGQVWQAVRNYEFHKATGLINRWVATDLSAFYLEALKDRLYCGDGGGALEPIFIGFLRMLAPITPTLVEEAWSHRPSWMERDVNLDHPARQLYESPLMDSSRLTVDPDKLRRDAASLELVHAAVKAGLEQAREAKALGSSLQCSVVIRTENSELLTLLGEYLDELDAIFVVSHVDVNKAVDDGGAWCYTKGFELPAAPGGMVHVLPPRLDKCSRCWRYLAAREDGLCDRCEGVVGRVAAAA
ncbi:isoleucine-tRNA ligase [Metarhizium album ARSEF 1941]|uniref:Isoleucine--tRNA ligase, mitochondrial n=1 Tax=Metarhizium album (strain ARSEF 1941) TaxID=1081103 RepID=A0A0B2WKX7_METAS|nr:isoleucine-tRNA ligase [Metarhizium album ARSEF 1941]KHN96706.1 isoleucine-tRNA ligase [Metarhizium album ARSEF 1941]